jgi:L-iditol 2-dehydrogenase
LVLVGLTGRPAVPVDTDGLVVGDQELVGTVGSPGVWPDVLAILARGEVRPSAIVTHRYPLDAWEEGFAVMAAAGRGVGKVLVLPQS